MSSDPSLSLAVPALRLRRRPRGGTAGVAVSALLLVTFGYKLQIVYESLAVKYAYYALNGVIYTYLILAYGGAACRRLRGRIPLLLAVMIGWMLFTSVFHDMLSVAFALISGLGIVVWAIVMPHLFTQDPRLWHTLRRVLSGLLLACVALLILAPGRAFEHGRFRGVFVAIGPATNFLLIATIVLFPTARRRYLWYALPLLVVLQLLTRTRSMIVVTVVVIMSLVVVLVRQNVLPVGRAVFMGLGPMTKLR